MVWYNEVEVLWSVLFDFLTSEFETILISLMCNAIKNSTSDNGGTQKETLPKIVIIIFNNAVVQSAAGSALYGTGATTLLTAYLIIASEWVVCKKSNHSTNK